MKQTRRGSSPPRSTMDATTEDDQLDLRAKADIAELHELRLLMAKADLIAAIAESATTDMIHSQYDSDRTTAKIAARAAIALRCAEHSTQIRLLDHLYYTGDAAKFDAAHQLAHDLSLKLAAAYTMLGHLPAYPSAGGSGHR